jgi:uncharacterized membrane protein YidH (DUF202 family)
VRSSESGCHMTDNKMSQPSTGRMPLIAGVVLVLVGLAGVAQFGFGTPGADSTGAHVAWEAGLTIGAAVAIGVGLLLVAIAVTKRTRMKAQTRPRAGANTRSQPRQ